MKAASPIVSGYAGLQRFQPMRIRRCGTVGAVQEAVREAGRDALHVRAVGLGYSWSPSAVTDDLAISVEGLRTVSVDAGRRTVTAAAGARLADVSLALSARGLCLPSLPFLADMTIGGTVATASHGTSARWGTVSDFVRSIEIVTASGALLRLGGDPSADALRAARVSVGMLGVIVRVELEAEPIGAVRPRRTAVDLRRLREDVGEIVDAHEHVWIRWTLGSDRAEVFALERGASSEPGTHPYVQGSNARWIAPGNGLAHRIPPGLSRLRGVASWRRRGLAADEPDPFRPDGDAPVRVSMQYALPRDRIGEALERIGASAFAASNGGRVLELKFLKGSDRSFLGPNSDGDVVLFNAYWLIEAARRFSALRPFEEMMRGLGGRPHWGKLHRPLDLAFMARVFPRWPDFDRVRRTLDPSHMFTVFPEELAPENGRASRGPATPAERDAVTGAGSR